MDLFQAQLGHFATMVSLLLEQHELWTVCRKTRILFPISPHARSLDQEVGAMLAIAGSSFAGVIACSAVLYLLF